MSEIYGNSYVTIAAFVDVDTHSGFLRERPDKVLSKSHIRSIKSRKEIDHVSSLGRERLVQRARCYQERLVPRRVISLHVAEVTWECRSDHW